MANPDTRDEADTDMAEGGGESTNERYVRYRAGTQDEVSEPDEWANAQYGHMDQWQFERMVAYSRANWIRLDRVAGILRNRHDEKIARHLRALEGVEALMDIA